MIYFLITMYLVGLAASAVIAFIYSSDAALPRWMRWFVLFCVFFWPLALSVSALKGSVKLSMAIGSWLMAPNEQEQS